MKTIQRNCGGRTSSCLLLALIVALFCIGQAFGADNVTRLGDREIDAAEQLHVDEFGTTLGDSVTNGFVFINGQYVNAPYRIIRKGLAVLINDWIIEPPMPWPIQEPKSDPLLGESDPSPVGITVTNSEWDSVVQHYLMQKRAYIAKHQPPGKETELMAQAYKSLPCVKEAISTEPGVVKVTWSDGVTVFVRLHPPSRPSIKLDKESVLKRLDAERSNYEERLQKGDAFFLFRDGLRITSAASSVKSELPILVTILRSGRTEEAKLDEIDRAGIYHIGRDNLIRIITTFSASSQLDARLEDLAKPDAGRKVGSGER